VIVDLAVGEIAAILAQLDQQLEPVAACLVFLGRDRATRNEILGVLAPLATTLRDLDIRNDFNVGIRIHAIIVVGVRIALGRTAGTTRGRRDDQVSQFFFSFLAFCSGS